ncbi:unnamed protein product [Prorocentrum cordatum]|uniref:Uncharacterized protein n=1 Tax=Prorocentrum cordatum TaxID=2364126 RepID=A0ABN9U7G4_9DINO|nr:unnamed protein product [Polarella glacialis]
MFGSDARLQGGHVVPACLCASHSTQGSRTSLLGTPVPRGEQLRRKVYISLSSLMARCDREGEAVLHTIPPDALFLFGSKRSWVFPESAAEQEESRSENPRYTMAKYEGLRSLIVDKEARGEVFFLKPPGFKYSGDLFHGDPEAYQRTSAWLQGHLDPATDRHYSPLLLDPAWWQNEFQPGTAAYTSSVETITKNFPNGAHDYRPLMELLHQSNPTLDIVVP